ncbi:hypothetical protein BJY00DRAFT_220519 [Aspergillus carlsbadensis]|nr:hypothetical protein BJY00DRAFT_220519 [Aspergillus carlsbadensis]
MSPWKEREPASPWPGQHPVKILNADGFTQAILVLLMRDFEKPNSKLWYLWDEMVSEMKSAFWPTNASRNPYSI